MRKPRARQGRSSSPPLMTRAEARRYLARWEAVARRQLDDLRKQTVRQKFDELNDLFAWGDELGWRLRPADDERVVWERWKTLRERCRG